LWCFVNQLTGLDVSMNTALGDLSCMYNQLSVASLNVLFGTLHSNTISGKVISVFGNPGADTCNPGIATEKGWKVETVLQND